tara:strand:+ start:5088 stop:5954 length:867 start_codon:yes stop_codon:yes gene_type:complete
MKNYTIKILILTIFINCKFGFSQPEIPVEKWKGKTVLLVGAHPDDDYMSHGTLALLNENENDIFILTLTTGNVGTKDLKISKSDLSKIRKEEQLNAMKILGLNEENYINLGYDDGRLEFANKEEIIGKIVYYIRKIRPDILMSFDPGYNYQVWHKSDHRAAAYLSADAVRAAEWHLMYDGQIIFDDLKAHAIPEFLFYGGNPDDKNTNVNIEIYFEKKILSGSKYISQWSNGWDNYLGSDYKNYPDGEKERVFKWLRKKTKFIDGIPVEQFRYYKGIPDRMGHGKRRN